MPTRLIDLGMYGGPEHPRICVPEDENVQAPYFTLSHCWGVPGGPQPPKLTSTNLPAYRKKIAIALLPKTFRDAIKITRRLGGRYLWIDCLCIIQKQSPDEPDPGALADWSRESALMGKVYRGSQCNIAAERAKDSSEGLFAQRNPWQLDVLEIGSVRIPGLPHGNYLCVSEHYLRSLHDEPLRNRAWVVQERLLAPRQISFGSRQLSWTCSEVSACEAFPAGYPD